MVCLSLIQPVLCKKLVIEILCAAERLIQSPSGSGGVARNITDQHLKSENVLLDVSRVLAHPADGNPDGVRHPVRRSAGFLHWIPVPLGSTVLSVILLGF